MENYQGTLDEDKVVPLIQTVYLCFGMLIMFDISEAVKLVSQQRGA